MPPDSSLNLCRRQGCVLRKAFFRKGVGEAAMEVPQEEKSIIGGTSTLAEEPRASLSLPEARTGPFTGVKVHREGEKTRASSTDISTESDSEKDAAVAFRAVKKPIGRKAEYLLQKNTWSLLCNATRSAACLSSRFLEANFYLPQQNAENRLWVHDLLVMTLPIAQGEKQLKNLL